MLGVINTGLSERIIPDVIRAPRAGESKLAGIDTPIL